MPYAFLLLIFNQITKISKFQKKSQNFFSKKFSKKKSEIFFSNQNLDLKVSGAQKDCLENIFPKFDVAVTIRSALFVVAKKIEGNHQKNSV